MTDPKHLGVAMAAVLALSWGASACDDAPETDGAPATSVTDDVLETSVADDCTQDALSGFGDTFVFTSAHRVVDGELGELCFGTPDPAIVDAWDHLAIIAPVEQLSDLALFGGFEPDGDEAAETLAFVNPLDDGSQFQMSVNTVEASADPDELLLTLAHEFSHVFTATPEQLDRSDEAVDGCATYFNGEGCYLDDALMTAWIDEFWSADLLDGVDPLEDSVDDAEARCALDEGFFGPYAATNPEEDFAEAFSAFVFRLQPATDGQARRLEWIGRQPGLAEFGERADTAEMGPLANNFELCG